MKRIIVIVVLAAILLVAWYGYHEYNRKSKDLSDSTPQFIVDANSLIKEFEKDSAAANKRYTDKIVEVKGTVRDKDANGNPVVLFLGEQGRISSVKCSMDSTHAADYKSVDKGMAVTLKGICTGGQTQDLFGTDVTLNRCVLENKK